MKWNEASAIFLVVFTLVDAPTRPVSSGRGSHVPQVTLDRHLVTACKTTTTTTKIATWNVRTMLQKGKLDNIKLEMERMKINILGLSEVRWQGAGVITSGNYKIFYSGGTTHERGVGIILDKEIGKAVKGYWTLSDRIILLKIAGKPLDINIIQVYAPTSACSDDDIEKFYEELEEVKTQCSQQNPLIIMGDFNAKVGEGREENIVGPHGLGTRNLRGEKLVEWCKMNNLIIGNTWFQQPPRRKWTWKCPGEEIRNQIDFILLRMLEGKRSRGKQREKLIEGLTDWLRAGKSLEAIEATKDRKKWRTMIANAVKQGT
ncbi:craniofacial development protein 2-like protein [Plakobranchus ocellatus]|uniref:Craniofacial development protein 2-like protein n=1 Tax=Plakobranchus ocellatus TaxID=259542 RepID=A0AAV4CXZ6_9GAST|nr:craniofacial development protein 2-like protein [Plakobranchus ocellatus]